MKTKTLLGLCLVVGVTAAWAADDKTPQHEKEGPCHEIKVACEKAGFVKGEYKEGYGLWVDCIDPIMQGKAQPKNAVKALPKVSADTVSACKAKHPEFGEGHAKATTGQQPAPQAPKK
jgi:hypothetical protein